MALSERRNRILSAVIQDYVQTAEPVGSLSLVQRHDFGVRPATVRNELAAMSEMGYLRQPHTSAGRVPSDLGYRYYVDELMPNPSLPEDDVARVRRSYDPYDSEIESILHRTCRILAGLTRYTSLATPPQAETVSIKHVALSPIGQGKVLLVTVLNTGHIDNRVLELPCPSVADLIRLGNCLNERLAGVDLNSLARSAKPPLPTELMHLSDLYKKVTSVLRQVLLAATDDRIYVEGAGHILKQPEFANTSRASTILEALEERTTLFQILSTALLGRDVTVIIGSENRFEEMQDCSFVASSYSVGDRVCGTIGILGPTRMDYLRAVAAVRFMASNLSELLTTLSI